MEFMQNEEKMEAVAFLADITSHLNDLNLKLQGKNNTVCELMSAVRAFQRKLEVFKSDLQEGMLHFPKLLEQTKGDNRPQNHVGFLEKLIENFKTRFDDFRLGKQVLLYIENPFLRDLGPGLHLAPPLPHCERHDLQIPWLRLDENKRASLK
ncbi:General transcription factor II-I repeat domain containing protein 2 [Dissostichus eleginoides]|uniref:General transcription factor II-I repeat domain containing protein 2 n=1 Tax=Dissostichus eleginoides TaxID=100907 RepID=A0AAD9F5H0_DISEL|nr:General transcription factor II-I repeat domain containing protein 2 [Dissostichus eleginoides]